MRGFIEDSLYGNIGNLKSARYRRSVYLENDLHVEDGGILVNGEIGDYQILS